ncbi:Molybdopterin-guanine dinucleotide biosynthesis protein A [Geobacillus sp. WSUCF1]|nr:Molybdopterin-guanine dinucleotide biosynthesis protein A [Geobacillus sp. WSUCF1]
MNVFNYFVSFIWRPKAFALYEGAPFFTWSVAALDPVADELYIVQPPVACR